MDEIRKMGNEINYNDLTYHCTTSGIALINCIGFRGPTHIYNEINDGHVTLDKIEENQRTFK